METRTKTMTTTSTPARVHAFSPFNFAAGVAALALIFTAFTAIDFDLLEIVKGGPRLTRLLGQMWPLNVEALPRLLDSLWITFLMAICGTSLGIVISLPLVLFAARNLTPHPMVRFVVRSFISFCRTVPDLIWALIFVIVVGLGPVAGALAIMMDSIGFLGKFFSEASEEQDVQSRPWAEAALMSPCRWYCRAPCRRSPAMLCSPWKRRSAHP